MVFGMCRLEDCCGCDYVSIFDGPSVNSRLLWKLCENNHMVQDSFQSSSTQITVLFRTDGSGSRRGFNANFTSSLTSGSDALFAEKYVTLSCLKPVLQLFNSELLQGKDEDTDLTKTINSSILDYLNTKYKEPEIEELINIATMLDPRFRTQHMSQEEILVIKARVFREVESLSVMPSGAAAPEKSPGQDKPKVHRRSRGRVLEAFSRSQLLRDQPF
ncbi:hypothetical protein NHX12_022240 [Muraenolepis orangiensis]|uniref:CUB domain-containing protein n=1 Tax=Muraenolepis orangiensis TaxID=630683 RepID=A0A9Q0EN99_9TELE|nr:hypothetical protein NHX12_022240 [Muraenolepis orangiensis]